MFFFLTVEHCCLVYWEGEDTVTVLSQEKVCYKEQIIGGSCIVREGRIIHTHGRLAAFGMSIGLAGMHIHIQMYMLNDTSKYIQGMYNAPK